MVLAALATCVRAQSSVQEKSTTNPIPGRNELGDEFAALRPSLLPKGFDSILLLQIDSRENIDDGLSITPFSSLAFFDRDHLAASIDALKHLEERHTPVAHEAEIKLLGALQILSASDDSVRTRQWVLDELEHIPSEDLRAEPAALGEYYFWCAELSRSLASNRLALGYYDSTLAVELPKPYLLFARYRKAELQESILLSAEARKEYDRIASDSINNPFRLLGLLKEASLLRMQGEYAILRQTVSQAESIIADSTHPLTYDLRYDPKRSPFLSVTEYPEERTPRIVGSERHSHSYNTDLPLYSPLLPSIYCDVLLASALCHDKDYTSSSTLLQQAERTIAHADSSTKARYTNTLRYLSHLVVFERAWIALSIGNNKEAASEFNSLVRDDTSSTAGARSARAVSGYTGLFYHDTIAVTPQRDGTSPGDRIYDDIPSRSRFYAAIALSRSGKLEEARDRLIELSQDQSAIYSDKAGYHLALVEFMSGRMLQAESMLEPLSSHRSRAGVFASILLGDIEYRKANFARAAEHLGFALDNLSSYDTTLIAFTSLERGLSLVALGGWSDAAHDLRTFIATSRDGAPGMQEALFWLGRADLRTDSIAEASHCFRRVLSEYPKDDRTIDAEYGLAWALFRSGDYQAASASFAKVMKMDSISRYAYDALSRRGDAFYAAGNLQKAVGIYNLAVDRPTFNEYRTTRSMFQLGVLRMRDDSARSAMNAFEYILRKYPSSDLAERCYYNAAIAAFAIKLGDKASDLISTLVKKFPVSIFAPKGEYLLASERERGGDLDGAYKAYRKIVAKYPHSEEFERAIFGALNALVEEEEYQKAVTLADSVLKEYRDKPFVSKVLYRKGEIETLAEDNDAAISVFTTFGKEFPNDTLYPMSRVLLARAMLSAGRARNEPQKILSDVVDQFPDRDAASFALLTLARMAKKDQSDNVASFYTHAFDMRYYSSDAAPVAMYEYGLWLKESADRIDSSNAVFDELTKRYLIETTIGAKAQLQVVASLVANGEHSKAISRLERISSAHSDDAIGAGATLQIAEQYVALGDHAKALATFDHAREVFDLSGEQIGESYLGSARADVKLGRKKAAVTILRKMLTVRSVPTSKRQQAQTLLQTLAPAKKKKK